MRRAEPSRFARLPSRAPPFRLAAGFGSCRASGRCAAFTLFREKSAFFVPVADGLSAFAFAVVPGGLRMA